MLNTDRQARILVVDDDPEICAMLSGFLHEHRLHVVTAGDAAEAEKETPEKTEPLKPAPQIATPAKTDPPKKTEPKKVADPPLTPKKIQAILDEALDFTQAAQDFWQKGELENAFEALDQAYSLILKVDDKV